MKHKLFSMTAIALFSFSASAGEWMYRLEADRLTGSLAYESITVISTDNKHSLALVKYASGVKTVMFSSSEKLIDCNPYRSNCKIRLKTDDNNKTVETISGDVSKDFRYWSIGGRDYRVDLMHMQLGQSKNIKIEYSPYKEQMTIAEFNVSATVAKQWSSFLYK